MTFFNLIIILIILVPFFLFLFPNLIIAVILYRLLLVRTSKKKWSRKCSKLKSKEQLEMFSRGIQWMNENKTSMTHASINNKGLNLYGEYFNFGFKKAVIIIAGRSEGCLYSCYYAKPYKACGYNILVIDNRCNGLSDGKYLSFGINEYTDILLWGKFLHEKYAINSVILHGICTGAATALNTLTSENLPLYFKGMIADGMYSTFYDVFRNHIISFKQPVFPVLQIVFFMIKHISKVDAKNNGPVYCIQNLHKPILFIHSKQDKYSLPSEIKSVYEKCHSPKNIVWFEKGEHSHIRINNEKKYDQSIIHFLKQC